jgi:hypothetical protein
VIPASAYKGKNLKRLNMNPSLKEQTKFARALGFGGLHDFLPWYDDAYGGDYVQGETIDGVPVSHDMYQWLSNNPPPPTIGDPDSMARRMWITPHKMKNQGYTSKYSTDEGGLKIPLPEDIEKLPRGFAEKMMKSWQRVAPGYYLDNKLPIDGHDLLPGDYVPATYLRARQYPRYWQLKQFIWDQLSNHAKLNRDYPWGDNGDTGEDEDYQRKIAFLHNHPDEEFDEYYNPEDDEDYEEFDEYYNPEDDEDEEDEDEDMPAPPVRKRAASSGSASSSGPAAKKSKTSTEAAAAPAKKKAKKPTGNMAKMLKLHNLSQKFNK